MFCEYWVVLDCDVSLCDITKATCLPWFIWAEYHCVRNFSANTASMCSCERVLLSVGLGV